jgi:hypothetical protein
LGRLSLQLVPGVPYRGDHEVRQCLGVVGIDGLRGDGKVDELTFPGEGRFHEAATGGALDAQLGEFFLTTGKLVAHLLGLLQQLLEVESARCHACLRTVGAVTMVAEPSLRRPGPRLSPPAAMIMKDYRAYHPDKLS